MTEKSDGAAVKQTLLTNVPEQWGFSWTDGVFTYRFQGSQMFDAASYSYIYLQNYEQVENASGARRWGETLLNYSRYAGDVTYFSRGYERAYGNNSDGSRFSWSWNYNNAGQSLYGNFTTFGADYGFDISLTGSDGTTLVLSKIRTTTPFEYVYQLPFTCYPFDYSSSYGFPYYGQYCEESDYSYIGKQFNGGHWEDLVP